MFADTYDYDSDDVASNLFNLYLCLDSAVVVQKVRSDNRNSVEVIPGEKYARVVRDALDHMGDCPNGQDSSNALRSLKSYLEERIEYIELYFAFEGDAELAGEYAAYKDCLREIEKAVKKIEFSRRMRDG